jgi:hypothetical protein
MEMPKAHADPQYAAWLHGLKMACDTFINKLMGAALGAFVVVAGPPELEVGSKFYPGLGFSGMPMRRGSHGFYIACKHCNRELEN